MDFELDSETIMAGILAIAGFFVVLVMFKYWSFQGLHYNIFIRLIAAATTSVLGFFLAKFIFSR